MKTNSNMNLKTMKLLLYTLMITFMISCSKNNGDIYLGNYQNGIRYFLIKKAGDDGYFVTFGNREYGENTVYCKYENGCFYKESEKNKIPIVCYNDGNFVSNEGITYLKVRQIKL